MWEKQLQEWPERLDRMIYARATGTCWHIKNPTEGKGRRSGQDGEVIFVACWVDTFPKHLKPSRALSSYITVSIRHFSHFLLPFSSSSSFSLFLVLLVLHHLCPFLFTFLFLAIHLKDLGVIVISDTKYSKKYASASKKTNVILGFTARNAEYKTPEIILSLLIQVTGETLTRIRCVFLVHRLQEEHRITPFFDLPITTFLWLEFLQETV